MSGSPQSDARAAIAMVSVPAEFRILAIVAGIPIVVVAGYLGTHEPSSSTSQLVGAFSQLVFALLATVACARAARRRGPFSRGWALMGMACLVWTLAMVTYTYYGITRNHDYPFPSLADVGFVGYALPAILGLLAFPRSPSLLVTKWRSVLDAIVISTGILLVSWLTVLQPTVQAGGAGTFAGLVELAYPIADVTICSVVLTLGMRQRPGERLFWSLLGGGLLTLAVADSIFTRMLAQGHPAPTGTPVVAGWMTAFLLVQLAALVPSSNQQPTQAREHTLGQQLIPYLPVLSAIVVASLFRIQGNPILMGTGVVLLLGVTVRQVLIVAENVTLTRDLEAKVAARTAELSTLSSIVTSSTDAIVGVSVDGAITSWNPAAEGLYGYRADEVVGRPPAFLSLSELRVLNHLLDRAQRGQGLKGFQISWTRKDGTVVPVEMTISSILDEDVVRGISIFGQDITERQQAAAALVSAREEALELSRLKSEFLATMSHEIRTPMNGVIGLTALLLETSLDEVQRQYAEGVQGAGEALLSVINDILDFSKLEAGKVELEVTDFDLRRMVEDVGALVAPAAYVKQLELLAYCLPDVPDTLRGDAGRIRQILLNLASNAVKFTSSGEVAIQVRSFPAENGRVLVRFKVSDTGIGIAEQDRERLFQSFSQADASTTRRYGGTGLGLTISLRLVEAMEGRIGFDSEVGVGSNFWFEISLEAGSAPPAETPLGSHDLLTSLRVLVVDDNATNRQILRTQLTLWHMRPDLVQDAASALARMRDMASQGQRYHIAVLDMCMPTTDGLQLAQAISADPALDGTKMIMLTSTSQVDAAALKRAGVAEWLTKPVRSSEFYDRLMRLTAPDPMTIATPHKVTNVAQRTAGSLGRVLVVEDNALNQLVAEGVVSKLGYQVDIVANGVEALVAIDNTAYAAVLMDCHMPVMDGFDATKEIRRRGDANSAIPIIAMTAGAMADDRERCLAAGMNDYVSKPVKVQAIQDVLARWVTASPDLPTRAPSTPMETVTEPVQPAIDQQRLADLIELGSPEDSRFLAAIIDSFTRHSADNLATIREAADAHSTSDLHSAAHELKGASANIGAQRVAAVCSQLETDKHQTDSDTTNDLINQL